MSDRGHPIFAFVFDRMSRSIDERWLGELRDEVVGRATGVVVEVGAGTGNNFRHYPRGVSEVLATEPDPYMLKRAMKAAPAAPVPVRVERAPADRLPVEDGAVDTVVATLVLCTVPDPDAALAEIRRVLKPGGAMLFLEHVRAQDPVLARRQDRIRPIWSFFAGGCHPNRDTVTAIERAGFEFDRLERFDLRPGPKLSRPHVKGVARKA